MRMTRNNQVVRTRKCLEPCEPARVDASITGDSAGGGDRDGPDQRTQLLDTPPFDVTQGHSHHNRQGQADTGAHFRQPADEVLLQAEAVVDAVVDPFQGITVVVTALPTRAAVRGRHEDAPIMRVEIDAHDAPVVARIDAAGLVTLLAACAFEPLSGRRAAVFERVAIGLEALEGEIALLTGLRADTVNAAFFGVDDGVHPLGKQRLGDGFGGIVVGVLLFFAPRLAGVDEGTDAVLFPQQGLGLGAVETAIGTEVAATPGQFRFLFEGLTDHGPQLDLLGGGRRGDMHGHGDFMAGVGDRVRTVTGPAFDRLPWLAGTCIRPCGFMLAPIRVGIGGLAGGTIGSASAVAFDGLAIVTEMLSEIGQYLHRLSAQGRDHLRHQSQALF